MPYFFSSISKNDPDVLISVVAVDSSLTKIEERDINLITPTKDYNLVISENKIKCGAVFVSYRFNDSNEQINKSVLFNSEGDIVDHFDEDCKKPEYKKLEKINYTDNEYLLSSDFMSTYLTTKNEVKLKVFFTKDGEDFFPEFLNVYSFSKDFKNIYKFDVDKNVAGPYFGTIFSKNITIASKYYFVIKAKESDEVKSDYVIIENIVK